MYAVQRLNNETTIRIVYNFHVNTGFFGIAERKEANNLLKREFDIFRQ